MLMLRRWLYILLVPLHVGALAWVIAGRVLFGLTFGWLGVFGVISLPVACGALGPPIALSYTCRLPRAQGRVSTALALAHGGYLVAMFVLGACLADTTDGATPHDISVIECLFGRHAGHLADQLAVVSIIAAALAWVSMLRATASQRRWRDLQLCQPRLPAGAPPPPPPPPPWIR